MLRSFFDRCIYLRYLLSYTPIIISKLIGIGWKLNLHYLVEEPAAAGITRAAVGDVGEPDGFFWSSSEDSNDVWPVCRVSGKPSESLREAALALQIVNNHINYIYRQHVQQTLINFLYWIFFFQHSKDWNFWLPTKIKVDKFVFLLLLLFTQTTGSFIPKFNETTLELWLIIGKRNFEDELWCV